MINSDFQRTELPTGLRIVSEKIPGVYSIALGIWIEIGSRDEDATDNGMVHFIEHMLFKGTRNRTTHEIAESMESVGGSMDAFTAKEVTCFATHFLHEHLPLAVDVLADILQNPLFDVHEIEKEKEVITQEIYHYQDTPEDLVFEHFYHDLFGEHPLGYHIYGSVANVKKFNRADLKKFLLENFAANRMVVAAAGKVDHQQLVDLVVDKFKDHQPASPRQLLNVEKINRGEHRVDYKCIQAHICLGMPAYPYQDEKRYPLMMLNTLLGAGMSSRLFQKIREVHGLAYTVYSFNDFYIDTGIFGIYLETEKENIALSLELIQEECNELVVNFITENEINKVKQQLRGNLLLSLENTFSRMNRLAKLEIYFKKFIPFDDVIKKIQQVTPDHVQQLAGELFKNDQHFLTVLYPAEVATNS